MRLNELDVAHEEILRKKDLYVKLREHGELQEKKLINPMLTDPFGSNFTNSLKREINVKLF